MFLNKKRDTAASEDFMKEDELPSEFEDILNNKELRQKLMDFLERRLANESLLFYESIENYEKITSPSLRNKAGAMIVKEFIKPESIYWVNISSASSKRLIETTSFAPETFSLVKGEVFNLMSSNFFDAFKRHLSGADSADAPQLPADSAFPDFTKSLTFEQLAAALGEAPQTTESSPRGSTTRGRLGSSVSIPSIIRRRLAKPAHGEQETKTRIKAMRLLNRQKRGKGVRSSFKLFKELEEE